MREKQKKEINPLAIIVFVVLALYALSMVGVLFWSLMTAIKDANEYTLGVVDKVTDQLVVNRLWWPKKLAFDNFIVAIKAFTVESYAKQNANGEIIQPEIPYNLFWQFVNSLLYAGGAAASVTVVNLVMGYATARFNYKFSAIIVTFVLIAMALPVVGSLPSEISVAMKLNIYDTFWGLWIMRGSFLNTYFLIFHAQFKAIPRDYTEAAKIDGANPLSVMLKIIVPLATGTMLTIFVLAFISFWNDFQIPMVYLRSYPVAAYGLHYFVNGANNQIREVPYQLAAALIVAIPIVIFYIAFNKQLNVNLSVGGIKG